MMTKKDNMYVSKQDISCPPLFLPLPIACRASFCDAYWWSLLRCVTETRNVNTDANGWIRIFFLFFWSNSGKPITKPIYNLTHHYHTHVMQHHRCCKKVEIYTKHRQKKTRKNGLALTFYWPKVPCWRLLASKQTRHGEVYSTQQYFFCEKVFFAFLGTSSFGFSWWWW